MPRVVKGSRQQRMTVVPYRPWQRALLLAGFITLVAALALVAYRAGMYHGSRPQESAEAPEVLSAPAQLAEMQLALSVMERTRQLDQEANVQAQAAIAELRSKVVTLERDVALYRQVMALDAAQPGLSVQRWILHDTELADHFRYHLVLAHAGTEGASVVGTLRLLVEGVNEDMVIAADEEVQDSAWLEVSEAVNMRYLQAMEGDIALPPGFRPQRIKLQFDDNSSSGLQFNDTLPWQPQEE